MALAAGRAGWRLAHRVGCGPDSATADKVFALMLQLAKQQGTAFVVVTHDETLAARCDRQLRLVAGRLQP